MPQIKKSNAPATIRRQPPPPKLLALEDAAPTWTRRAELRGAEFVDATNDQFGLCRAITSLRLAIEDKKEEHSSPTREPEPSVVASPGEPSDKPTASTDVDNMVAAIKKQFPALAAKSEPKPGAKAKAKAEAGPKAGPKPPKAKGKGKGGAKAEPKKPPLAKGKGKGGAKAEPKVKKNNRDEEGGSGWSPGQVSAMPNKKARSYQVWPVHNLLGT